MRSSRALLPAIRCWRRSRRPTFICWPQGASTSNQHSTWRLKTPMPASRQLLIAAFQLSRQHRRDPGCGDAGRRTNGLTSTLGACATSSQLGAWLDASLTLYREHGDTLGIRASAAQPRGVRPHPGKVRRGTSLARSGAAGARGKRAPSDVTLVKLGGLILSQRERAGAARSDVRPRATFTQVPGRGNPLSGVHAQFGYRQPADSAGDRRGRAACSQCVVSDDR
jgi:hypothetical protein